MKNINEIDELSWSKGLPRAAPHRFSQGLEGVPTN